MLALNSGQCCLVPLLLLILQSTVAAEEEVPHAALIGVFVSTVTSPEKKTAALDRNEFLPLGSPWIFRYRTFQLAVLCWSLQNWELFHSVSLWNFMPVLKRRTCKENLNLL